MFWVVYKGDELPRGHVGLGIDFVAMTDKVVRCFLVGYCISNVGEGAVKVE